MESVSDCPAVLVPPPLGVTEIDWYVFAERSLTMCSTLAGDFGEMTTSGSTCQMELSVDAMLRVDSSVSTTRVKTALF